MADQPIKLTVEQLRHRFDPAAFDFKSTEELPAFEEIIGQERALRAISFGINIRSQGYHMYALGPVGTGKKTIISKHLKAIAEDKAVPDDWLYVNNFDESDNPKAIRLPAGKGKEFRDELDQLVEELRTDVPKAFESKEYREEREEIKNSFNQKSQAFFQKLEEKVKKAGFRLLQSPEGFGVVPVIDGETINQDQYKELDEETRKLIDERQKELREEVQNTMRQAQELGKEARKEMQEHDRRVVGLAIDQIQRV